MEAVLYTIGFTKKPARTFFTILNQNRVVQLIDVRLNNSSQLAGYSKREDLQFFLEVVCHCSYRHIPDFAPSKELLDGYHKKLISWAEYETKYNALINLRAPHKTMSIEQLNMSCLLCSESTPDKCHRRLAAEYLQKQFSGLTVKHL